MPSDEPSPRPWRLEFRPPRMEKPHSEHEKAHFVDANGRDVWLSRKNAALIVDAVNERDRLRDIVRRMMEKLAVLNAGYRLMLSEGPEDADMADLCSRTETLVREARAAIGEGETPTGKGVEM